MLTETVDFCARTCAGLFPFECMNAGFMQYAMLAMLLIAPLTSISGIQVVNGRMAFFSDAIGHSVFAGVALGLIFGVSTIISVPLTAVVVGVSVMALKRNSRLSSDTIIGVIFSAVAAFGLAIVARNRGSVSSNTQTFLFGDVLTISDVQIAVLAGLLVVFICFQIFAFNRLLLIGINPMLAAVHRIRVSAYQYAFAILLSLVVIYSVHAVGVILMTALLIVPAAAARNFTHNSRSMFYVTLLISYVSCISGLILSAQPWADVSAGSAVVLCAVAVFFISMIAAAIRPKRASDSGI